MGASEEFEEEDSLEDEDEIPELVGTTDNSCLVSWEMM